jgi:hypothetical protein
LGKSSIRQLQSSLLSVASAFSKTDSGPSFQRYLPFWAANLIDRLKIIASADHWSIRSSLILPTYDWRMRSRINRWYKDLQARGAD